MKSIFLSLFTIMCFSCQSQKVESQSPQSVPNLLNSNISAKQLIGKWILKENYYIENNEKVEIGSKKCPIPSYWVFFEEKNAIVQESFTSRSQNCEQFIKSSSGIAQIENQMLKTMNGDVVKMVDIKKLTEQELIISYKEIYNGKMRTAVKVYQKAK